MWNCVESVDSTWGRSIQKYSKWNECFKWNRIRVKLVRRAFIPMAVFTLS